MATFSRLPASDMGRRAFAIFTKLVDVFVGLVNLIVLIDPNSVVAAYQKRNVKWYEALPPVLAVVVTGLATSKVVLKRLKPVALADKFSHRTRFPARCGAHPQQIIGSRTGRTALTDTGVVYTGYRGAAFGLGLGLVEGLILALPLAAILGLFRRAS